MSDSPQDSSPVIPGPSPAPNAPSGGPGKGQEAQTPQGKKVGPVANRRALYEALIAAFRENPGQTKVVGNKLGIARETAKRAWERGWPGMPPIQVVLADEGLAVRAQLYTEDARSFAGHRARELLETASAGAKREVAVAKEQAAQILADAERQAKEKMAELYRKAKLDSAQAIADRAQMLSLGRKSTIGAVALSALVMQNVQDISKQISEAIKNGGFKTPGAAIAAGYALTRMVESAERALLLHIQTENLEAGKPTEIMQVTSPADEMNLEETEKRLKQLQLAIERKKAKNLQLVQGGLSGSAT